MKSDPVVMDKFYTVHTSFIIDFSFSNNITIITGDSGTGKTAAFSFIRDSKVEDPRILCINYQDVNSDIKSAIEGASGKLIVIDNADILLNEEIRKSIALDSRNQYLILGRNASSLMATEDNFFELHSCSIGGKTKLYLKPYFS